MPAHRTNRSYRIAYISQIKSITWAASLTRYMHGWAMAILSILIPSAETVLQFLCALHRSNRYGYIGCAVAYEILAPQIALATRRKCSVRTLTRGIAALRALGLVQTTWWTIPDQRLECDLSTGRHTVVVRGTKRVHTKDGWKCLQIRILTLTSRATALWDLNTRKSGSDIMRHFLPHTTHAKLASNSQIDQCVNTHMIRQATFDNVKEDTVCDTLLNFEHNDDHSSPEKSSNVSEGQTTSSDHSLDGRCVEQQINQHVPQSNDETTIENSSPEIPDTVSEANKNDKNDKCPRGVSCDAPRLPKTHQPKNSWAVARSIILNTLHSALEHYSQREADSIYSRARFEMSGNYPTGWPTSVDWSYWIARFASFSREQRQYHMRREIIPLLRSKSPCVPTEPRRFSSESRILDKPAKISTVLEPFLAQLYDKFCR